MVDKSLPFFAVASGGIENEWYALTGHAWRLSLIFGKCNQKKLAHD